MKKKKKTKENLLNHLPEPGQLYQVGGTGAIFALSGKMGESIFLPPEAILLHFKTEIDRTFEKDGEIFYLHSFLDLDGRQLCFGSYWGDLFGRLKKVSCVEDFLSEEISL